MRVSESRKQAVGYSLESGATVTVTRIDVTLYEGYHMCYSQWSGKMREGLRGCGHKEMSRPEIWTVGKSMVKSRDDGVRRRNTGASGRKEGKTELGPEEGKMSTEKLRG